MAQLLDLPFDALVLIVAYLPVDHAARLPLACKRLKCVAERDSRIAAMKAAIVAAKNAAAVPCSDEDFADYSRLVLLSVFGREKRKRKPELEATLPLRRAKELKNCAIELLVGAPCATGCGRKATVICPQCGARICDDHMAPFFCHDCNGFSGCEQCNGYYIRTSPCDRCGVPICPMGAKAFYMPEVGQDPAAELCYACYELMH